MDAQKPGTLPPPPGVIASLQAGFNIVSGRVALIALPLALDLLLWLGPRLSVGNWFNSVLTAWINFLQQNGYPARELAVLSANLPSLVDVFERVNWLGWIRTLPIGIPTLMLNLPEELPAQTPLGVQAVFQLPSFFTIAGSALMLTLVGWLGGGWYFRLVAAASLGDNAQREAGIGLARAFVQTVLLSVLWIIGLVVVVTPILFLIGLLSLISALLAQAVFFIILFFLFWLVAPLFFTPHGIFVRRQNALLSILSSLRMSRFALPASSMFVLSIFLLSQGLGYLWLVPANDSWLRLVGIAGHAFISTMLLSASFVYYRDMDDWQQIVNERLQQMGGHSSMKKV